MKNCIGLLLGIALLLASVSTLVWILVTPGAYCYRGQETFYTEEAYQEFKVAVSNPDVLDWEISALTSSPPIVVNFKVDTTLDYQFPYGEQKGISIVNTGGYLTLYIFAIFATAAGIILALSNASSVFKQRKIQLP